MSVIIIGEAATKILEQFSELTRHHPEIPWHSMRGMRNRIAHGYLDINLDVVWETVQSAFPVLVNQLHQIQAREKDPEQPSL
nr:HepT-like ribonuclease domain-containing protein [Phyllobacterium sp. 2063]